MVYGHTCSDFFSRFLYFFHMPLFMMISGYFFSLKSDYGSFCRKKINSLYIPYLSYFFLGFLLNWLYEFIFYAAHPLLPSFADKITEAVLPLFATGATNGIWFLVALLVISLFWGGIMRLCNFYIALALAAGLSFSAFHFNSLGKLPFFLSPTLVLAIYFLGGYWLKMFAYSPEKIPVKWNWLIVFCGICIIGWACFYFPQIDYFYMSFPLPYILLIFLGVAGSMMIFSLSAILPVQFSFLTVLLQKTGKSTLWILGMHSTMLRYSRLLWNKAAILLPFLQKSSFLSNILVYITTLALLFGILLLIEKLLKKYGQEKYLSYLGIR